MVDNLLKKPATFTGLNRDDRPEFQITWTNRSFGHKNSRDIRIVQKKSATEQLQNEYLIYHKDKLVLNDAKDLPVTSKDDVIASRSFPSARFSCEVPPYKIRRKYIPAIALPKESETASKEIHEPSASTKGILKKLPGELVVPKSKTPNVRSGEASSRAKNLGEFPIAPVKSPESVDSVSSMELQDNATPDVSPERSVEQHASPSVEEKPPENPIADILNKMQEVLIPENPCILIWSGEDILKNKESHYADVHTGHMSNIKVWRRGYKGYMAKFRHAVKKLMQHPAVFWTYMLFCLINTTILALNRYEQPKSETRITAVFSKVFTYAFFVEITLKIVGFGIVKFCRDPLNCINACVGILNILEMIFADSLMDSNMSVSLQAFNTLRIFKVMRMFRLLRPLKSMKILLQVISNAIPSFIYTSLLLLLFLFIYSLFGMQLFGGRFDFPEGRPRQHYDSFYDAFLCTFQLLTIQNWEDLHYSSLRAQVKVVSALFYASWLIVGNYVLLSLFLAVMLNMFSEVHSEYDLGDESSVLHPQR